MDSVVRMPAIGDKLAGRFRVVFGRGAGPCGIVFKALDLALDLPVAVKVFNPDLFTSRFRDQNLLRLYRARAYQDPNLVKIYEVQEDKGRHFITCQLMEGMSLAAVLDLHAESGEHFTVPKIRAFVTRIFGGLSAIHKAGAIHGNLKPQNIFVLPDRLALSDPYCLVADLLQEGQEIPVTDYYRGPEQLTDPSLELKETDIYALALVIGEVIAGSPVQPGIPLSSQLSRLTTRFDDLFVRATSSDPFARPHALEDLSNGIMAILAQVESEGLWVRRYHETGSFRAVRLPHPKDETPTIQRVDVAAPVEPPAQPQSLSVEPPRFEPPPSLPVEPPRFEPPPLLPVEPPHFEPPPLPAESLVEDDRKVAAPTEEAVAEPEEFIPEEAVGLEEPPLFVQAPPIPQEAHEDEESVPLPPPVVAKEEVQRPRDAQAVGTRQPATARSTVVASAERVNGMPLWLPVALLLLFIVVGGGSLLWYLNRDTPVPGPAPTPATIESVVPVASDKVVVVPAETVKPTPSVPPVPATAPVPPPVPSPVVPTVSGIAAKLLCPPNMAKIVTNAMAQDKPDLDMSTIAFCIDAYEFPGKGQRPKGGVSGAAARRLCNGVGKRLCKASEWTRACGETYPYGNAYRADACNVSSGKMRPAGEMPDCKTDEGVFDLVGNASEWADDGSVHGGDTGGDKGTTCGTKSRRFMPSPTNGFRCCANPSR